MKIDEIERLLDGEGLPTSNVTNDLDKEYKDLFNTPSAKKINSIVYIYKTLGKGVPRLRGESNILYIGKSVGNLYSRYSLKKELNTYRNIYEYIIQEYGGFTVDIFQTDEPDKLESLLLWKYKEKYLELPPINLSSYNEKYVSEIKL